MTTLAMLLQGCKMVYRYIPNSAKFSRVFNFANFAGFQLFARLFQWTFLTRGLQFSRARASMDNILGLCCRIRKGHSPKRYHQSRHCFADSCELEHGRWCGQCVLDRTCLYATPILHYVAACAWLRDETKCSKTAIRGNLDPRKVSAIRHWSSETFMHVPLFQVHMHEGVKCVCLSVQEN